MTHPLIACIVIGTLGATFAGCSDAEPPAGSAAPVAPTSSTGTAALSIADVTFAQGMIAHHEQAVEMAEIALDPATQASPAVTSLATAIKAAQDPEIALMTGWLLGAGQPVAMDTSTGHDMSSMPGMMTVEQMDRLPQLRTTEFDRAWLEMMIDHHQGAISQSQTVLADGSDVRVRALATQIIAAQTAEIETMEGLLQPSPSTAG